ncbi:MAG: RNA polymerase sigma factor [Anaerolineales bacterium]
MSESKAITRLKQGDISGLEVLVRRFQVEAVHGAFLIIGDRQIAEDVVQNAFIRVADRIHQFEDGRPFRPWFLRIVTNDALKAVTRARGHLPLDGGDDFDVPEAWLQDLNPGPEEMLDTSETRQRVWRALQQLTPKQRTAIIMRYFLDMKNKEIARDLDLSLPSVKWSVHAAKENLRALLRPGSTSGSQAPPGSNEESGSGGGES